MPDWDLWIGMARESLEAATAAMEKGLGRSAMSRFYYAAYQAATAALLYRGLTPPADREAWTHDDTPLLMVQQLSPVVPRRDVRRDLLRRVSGLYRRRLIADYRAKQTLSANDLQEARRDAGYVVSTLGGVLPEEDDR